MNSKMKKAVVAVTVALVVLSVSVAAFALTGGSTTGVGGELYDLIVNKFIAGPIGATTGTVFVVVGAIMACMGKLSNAAWPLVAGGILGSASSLANSLGAIF